MSATYIPTSMVYHGGINLPLNAEPANAASVNANGFMFLSDDIAYLARRLGPLMNGGTITPSGPLVFESAVSVPSAGVAAGTITVNRHTVSSYLEVAGTTVDSSNRTITGNTTVASGKSFIVPHITSLGFDTLPGYARVGLPMEMVNVGRVLRRVQVGSTADASYSCDDYDNVQFPANATADRTYTIVESADPKQGDCIGFFNNNSVYNLTVKRPDTTTLIILGPGQKCDAVRDSGTYKAF